MNNKGLNAKIKIFIIVIYTIVLFSIILLSFGKSKINRFSEYQDKAYDDQIALNIRDIENRKSKLSTGSEDEEGKHEKSTHDLQIQLVKLRANTSIKNIKIYLAAKTLDNGYRYDEYTSSSKEMSTLTYTSLTSFTTFATKEIKELTKNGKKEEYLFDETPIEYYIRISYTLNDEKEERVLAYKTKALSFNQEKTFKNVEIRNIDNNNANYIESKDDPIKLKVTKTLISEESSLKEIKEDRLRVEFKVNSENLNKYKYDSDYLEKNNLISIELPKGPNDDDAWNVEPEINDIKFEIYGKIKNNDNKFSSYVKIYSIYGFLVKIGHYLLQHIKLMKFLTLILCI
ncbi:MAG: hypothetical protein ACLUG4_04455 [Bacilli bacterium]